MDAKVSFGVVSVVKANWKGGSMAPADAVNLATTTRSHSNLHTMTFIAPLPLLFQHSSTVV